MAVEVVKYTPAVEKPPKVSKPSSGAYGSASADRPFACPYEGCEKAYIHEYKLKLHLRREHPGHMAEENPESAPAAAHNPDHEMDEASDPEAYVVKRTSNGKNSKQSKSKHSVRAPPTKAAKRKASSPTPTPVAMVKKSWPVREEMYGEEDSEETEEDRENVEDGWRYTENHEDDDEETEYED